MVPIFAVLTCKTAFISRRSSVGFHRPRSLVICRGCLLFFTRLVMGAGFITMVRGGVRTAPDFAIWKKKRRRIYRYKNNHQIYTISIIHRFPCEYVDFVVVHTFFFSPDDGSLPEQRTGSITGGPLTLLDDFTRLLSTSSSSNFFLLIDLMKTFLFI